MMGNHKRVIMATGVWVAVFSACWAAEEGRRVTVPDDYLTITEAVDKVDPNDIIFIRNGTYNEDFSIKKPLTLEGESRDGVIIRAPADKFAVIYVKKYPVTFKNLTVEHSDQNTEKKNTACIRIEKSASTVENCLFRNSACYGVVIKYNCKATINNSVFENNKSCGIHVFDNFSMPVFTNNVLRDNIVGISLRKCNGLVEYNRLENNENGVNIGESQTTLTVRDNQFTYNKVGVTIWSDEQPEGDVIPFQNTWTEMNLSSDMAHTDQIIKAYTQIFGNKWLVIENNEFTDSRSCAVFAFGANVLTFLRNNRSKNCHNGYCSKDGAQMFITDCTAEANQKAGVLVYNKLTWVICLNSHIFDSKEDGVCMYDDAQGRIIHNTVINNKKCGIIANKVGGDFVAAYNQCHRNGNIGLYICASSSGWMVADNHAESNFSSGIGVADTQHDGDVKNNLCKNNNDNGLYVLNAGNVNVVHNICENNKINGIQVSGHHAKVVLNDNTCCYNNHSGITFFDNATGVIEKNICDRNERGINITDIPKIIVVENRCMNNNSYGVWIEKSSMELNKNKINNNGSEGICASGWGARCDIIGNECKGNYPCGIFFSEQAAGRIEGNVCCGHSWAGIALRDVGPEAVVAGNTCNDNGAWGIISYAGAEPVVQDNNIAENNGRGGIKHRPLAPEEKVAAWIRQGRAYVEVKNHLGAIECFRQTLAFVPEHTEALRLLGWACYEEGLKRSGKTASDNFDNAYKAFQQALSTAPHDLQSLYGLAAVMERRTIADDEQKIQTQQDVTQIFEKSLQASPRSLDRITLYSIHNISQANKAQKESALPFLEKTQAVLLQTLLCRKDNAELLSCLGMLYINYSYIVSDKKEDYLQKAEECLTRIDSGGLKTTSGAYNLACVYALQGKEEKCREYLVIAQDNGQLPSREHVMQDRDLASVRKKPWFRELKWPQDEKEPEQLEIPKDF